MISVIIPIYNVDKYLEKCLDSVVNQTLKNIEVILINDGSTDKSGEICELYANKDRRIKYIERKNQGVSTAREVGIREATGNYIAFIDSDDWIEKNMLENMYNEANINNADIVNCGYIKEDINGNEIITSNLNAYKKVFNRDEAIERIFDENGYKGFLWNKIFSRKLFDENNNFNENIHFCEDFLFCIKSFIKSNKIINHKGVYYHYISRAGSITNRNFSKKKITSLSAIQCAISMLDNNNIDSKKMREFYVNMNVSLLMYGKKEKKLEENDCEYLIACLYKYDDIVNKKLKLAKFLVKINFSISYYLWRLTVLTRKDNKYE